MRTLTLFALTCFTLCLAAACTGQPRTQRAAAAPGPSPASQPKPLAAREVSTGSDRVPHTRPAPGQMVEMTLKELGNFEFDPNKDAEVPADVNLLEGAKVRLKGVMVPLTQGEKITQFALMEPGSFESHDPPGPQRFVICKTAADKAVEYTYDHVIVVEGTLHIHIQRDDNYTNRIFEMAVTSVTQVQPATTK